MIKYAIIGLIILAIIYLNCRKKNSIALMMIALILAPRMTIMGAEIDSIYIIDIILLIYLFVAKKRFRLLPTMLNGYFKVVFFVMGVYIVAWLIVSRVDTMTLTTTVTGAFKLWIYVILCYNFNHRCMSDELKHEIFKMVFWGIALNAVGVIYEIVDYEGSKQFLSNVIFGESQITYLENTTKWGYYGRYYGFFAYPMGLGLFCSYSLAFLFWQAKRENRVLRIICAFMTLFCGIASASKSAVLGMSFVVVMYIFEIVYGIIRGKTSARFLYRVLFGLIIIALFYAGFDLIYNFIYASFGGNFARYLTYLEDFSSILSTRFSSDGGMIISNFDIIKNNFILGVGPSSIAGENVMDNAYIELLHNGGIIALFAVVILYIRLLNRVKFDYGCVVLVILILLTGMGFQTLISSTESLPFIYYLCVTPSICEGKNKMVHCKNMKTRRKYLNNGCVSPISE